MIVIKILISLFAVYTIYKMILKYIQSDMTLSLFIIWSAIWSGAVVVVWLPWTSDILASFIGFTDGVNKGIDLVIYVVIFMLVYAIYKLTLKLEHTEYEITQIVRNQTIAQVKQDNKLNKE